MYGYAPYAALWGSITGDEVLNLDAALTQLALIYRNARDSTTGLVKHGYQLSRNASWADTATGASPVIWGRSLAWYTVGLVDALEVAATRSPEVVATVTYHRTQALLRDIVAAEIEAVDKSVSETGRYGIWQVVDQPEAPGNFIESSAGALITFALAKTLRLGYMGDVHGRVSVLVRKMHQDLVERFVGHNQNGTLDYFGTSAMASLHQPNVDYEVCDSSLTFYCWNKPKRDLVLCQLAGHDEQLNRHECIRSSESRDRTDGLIRFVGYYSEKVIVGSCLDLLGYNVSNLMFRASCSSPADQWRDISLCSSLIVKLQHLLVECCTEKALTLNLQVPCRSPNAMRGR